MIHRSIPKGKGHKTKYGVSTWNAGRNCGIGPGGFQPGNTCAVGGDGGSKEPAIPPVGTRYMIDGKEYTVTGFGLPKTRGENKGRTSIVLKPAGTDDRVTRWLDELGASLSTPQTLPSPTEPKRIQPQPLLREHTVKEVSQKIKSLGGSPTTVSADEIIDRFSGPSRPSKSEVISALKQLAGGTDAKIEKRLIEEQVKEANAHRVSQGKQPVEYELRHLPLDKVKPSQSGEDYINESSTSLSKMIGQKWASGRLADYAPAVVDENLKIIDGNHRHAARRLAGISTIPVLVPKGITVNTGTTTLITRTEARGLSAPVAKLFDALKDLAVSGLTPKKRGLIGHKRKKPKLTVNEKYKFASTQFDIGDPLVTAEIEELQARLNPADVLKLEDRPHVTVLYGLNQIDPARLRPLLDQYGPIFARLGRLSLFENSDADVLKFDVQSSQLEQIQRHLRMLPHTLTQPEYIPHLTVAYLKPGTGAKYLELPNNLLGHELHFSGLTYSDRNGEGTVLNQVTIPVDCHCHQIDPLHQFSRLVFIQNKTPTQRALADAVYELMDDVTKQEAATIARTVLDGYSGDAGAEEVAKELRRKLGFDQARAMAVAVTETSRVRAADSLTAASQSGLKSVTFKASADACVICQGLNGRKFSIEKAQQKIPVHPHCSCTWDDPLIGNSLTDNRFCPTGVGGGVNPSCGSKATGSSSTSPLSQIKGMPREVYQKVKDTTAEIKKKLVDRYGAKTATVIVIAAQGTAWATAAAAPFAGIPGVWVPSAITALPYIGLAELYHQLTLKKKMATNQEEQDFYSTENIDKELSQEELEEAVRDLIKDLERELGPSSTIDIIENKSFFSDCNRDKKGRCLPSQESGSSLAPKSEILRSGALAIAKINGAPAPPPEKVEKMRAMLERAKIDPKARAGGDARGNANDRKARAQRLFEEWGGKEKGYVVCPWTGIKMHWASPDDKENNPKGYPKFEQGKIFTACQGGGYQLPNLIPESFTANRKRNDIRLREENSRGC